MNNVGKPVLYNRSIKNCQNLLPVGMQVALFGGDFMSTLSTLFRHFLYDVEFFAGDKHVTDKLRLL